MIDQATTTKPESATDAPPGELHGLLAEFAGPGALIDAAEQMKRAGYTQWDAHSPYPVHGIDPAAGIKMTKLPLLVFAGGFTGMLAGLFLQWWTNASSHETFSFVPTFLQGYQYLVSGKPFMSLPAFIPVMFELTILFAAITAGVGMLVMNNLPLFHQPLLANRKFAGVTTDKFFISVEAADAKFDEAQTAEFLRTIGGIDVERVLVPDPGPPAPAIFKHTAIVVGVFLLIPLGVIGFMRNNFSEEPRIHIVQDMDNQEKFKAQSANALFADERGMRLPPGATAANPVGTTVARGELYDDEHYYFGVVDGEFATTFPTHRDDVVLNAEFVQRGQQQFNVYCAACHGYDGQGNGIVNNRALARGAGSGRAWVQAANLLEAQYRDRSHGHIYNTITRGIRSMPGYYQQIDEADRWAVVAYVRALQRASQMQLDEVPAEKQQELKTR